MKSMEGLDEFPPGDGVDGPPKHIAAAFQGLMLRMGCIAKTGMHRASR